MAKERPDKVKEHVGSRISEIRRTAGLAQEVLADRLDVSGQWVSRAERGTENLTIESLVRIANALGSKVAEFFAPLEDDPDLPVKASPRPPRKKRR